MDAFARGERLALPFLEPRVTDPDKPRALSRAYRSYLDQTVPARELADLAAIFMEHARERARACHSDLLDQLLTRARFGVGVSIAAS
jgi:hypothetical protein